MHQYWVGVLGWDFKFPSGARSDSTCLQVELFVEAALATMGYVACMHAGRPLGCLLMYSTGTAASGVLQPAAVWPACINTGLVFGVWTVLVVCEDRAGSCDHLRVICLSARHCKFSRLQHHCVHVPCSLCASRQATQLLGTKLNAQGVCQPAAAWPACAVATMRHVCACVRGCVGTGMVEL
jgi:hypothetical protein